MQLHYFRFEAWPLRGDPGGCRRLLRHPAEAQVMESVRTAPYRSAGRRRSDLGGRYQSRVRQAWSIRMASLYLPKSPGPTLTTTRHSLIPRNMRRCSSMPRRSANISPTLLSALVWQESRWNPQALSPKGAMGLAQLMPAHRARARRQSGRSRRQPRQAARAIFVNCSIVSTATSKRHLPRTMPGPAVSAAPAVSPQSPKPKTTSPPSSAALHADSTGGNQ